MQWCFILQFGELFGGANPNKATLCQQDCVRVFGLGFIFRFRVLGLGL